MAASNQVDRALNKAAAAAMLGVAPVTVADARWRRRVGLRGFRVGGALRFRRRDVLALVQAGLERFPGEGRG